MSIIYTTCFFSFNLQIYNFLYFCIVTIYSHSPISYKLNITIDDWDRVYYLVKEQSYVECFKWAIKTSTDKNPRMHILQQDMRTWVMLITFQIQCQLWRITQFKRVMQHLVSSFLHNNSWEIIEPIPDFSLDNQHLSTDNVTFKRIARLYVRVWLNIKYFYRFRTKMPCRTCL